MSLVPTRRPERRRKKRVQLSRALPARAGTLDVLVVDISDGGSRIEHFTRLHIGRRLRFRIEWEGRSATVEAEVRSCRVHRFAPGDDGATVYQSGLQFVGGDNTAAAIIREMVAQHVARSLAEQVANARGIGPVTERNMPVFRSGVVATTAIDPSNARNIPKAAVVQERGYIRCALTGRRWDRKWTRSPEQPAEGFTVLASEPHDHVAQLCDTYLHGSPEQRRLIQALARVSVENADSLDTPEPIGV